VVMLALVSSDWKAWGFEAVFPAIGRRLAPAGRHRFTTATDTVYRNRRVRS
jgi:hypothetical protein